MPITAYCVRLAGQSPPPPGLRGVDGAALDLLEEAGLSLWFSVGREDTPTLERVRQHSHVVREALRTATPLPMRFGTFFIDEDAARAALRERQADFLAVLDRVAGCVEMGIRLLWEPASLDVRRQMEPAAADQPGTGREYLERRRSESELDAARMRQAEELLEAVLLSFAPLALPTAHRLLPEPTVAATLAHLVQRAELSSYNDCAKSARLALRNADLQISGPWAPYSFV